MDPSEHYEITLCFESPDQENADFVYEMFVALAAGFERASLIAVTLATVHPTFEGDEIREESEH